MRSKSLRINGFQPVNKSKRAIMRYLIGTAVIGIMFSGCITMSGYYSVDAYNSSGELLTKNTKMVANGSGIYTARNAMCSAFPNAVIIIHNTKTGEQLSSESPYHCR
jgi:hypothetical protein